MCPVDTTGTSLINLGEFAKPAVVLIEKISEAVGGIAAPWQIKRVAAAEAKADLIRANARIEISELEERALRRMVREEGKKQQNIENITGKSILLLSADAKPEEISNDWITNFFERSRLVSDTDMQQLWASMLAGEANVPGTFSKRAVELVSTLEKADAELFTKICGCAWSVRKLTPIIHDINRPFKDDDSFDFDDLQHLDSLGLIRVEGAGSFAELCIPKKLVVSYYGKKLVLQYPNDDANFSTGNVAFTKMGTELAAISGSVPNKAYFECIIERWILEDYNPYEIIGERTDAGNWYDT